MLDHIHRPDDPRVFVFGSNLKGIHGAGAALYASKSLGAWFGHHYGAMPDLINPRCFAIPTCSVPGRALPISEIANWVSLFLTAADNYNDKVFFVSAIGCGYAGYSEDVIAPLFANAPGNCDLSPGWR